MPNYISFPNLGLEFTINPVAFSFGSRDIYWYGIIMAISYFCGIFYAMKRSETFGLNEDIISDSILIIVPVSLICARLYYVIFSLHLYDNFWDIFKVWEGGIAIYGGVIGGALGLFITSKWKKIDFISFLDLGACSLLIGQAIGRWGNFVNAEAYGSQTNSFFMMSFGSEIGYHPTFLYESVWNFTGFVLMYVISKKFYKFRGQMALIYLSWYGLGRTFIEGLRVDSLWFGNFRVSQVLACATFIIATFLLIYILKKPQIIEKLQVNMTENTKIGGIENENS
ncbi:MAG: prolipoprotein diacylglyceryl transferase [Clostridia bacterium]